MYIKKQRDINGSIRILFCTVLLFLLIFNPPLVKGVSFTTLFAIGTIFLILLFPSKTSKILSSEYIGKWIALILVFLIYYSAMVVIYVLKRPVYAEDIISTYVANLVHVVSLLLSSFFVLFVFMYGNVRREEFYRCFIHVGVWQGILGGISFVVPDFKLFLNSWMKNNSGSDMIVRKIEESPHRFFGFASQLYDNFGFAMSILAIMALIYGLNGKKRGFLYALLIFFAAFINARVSIVLIVVGGMVLLLCRKGKRGAKLLQNISLIVLVGICFVVFMVFTSSRKTASSEWLTEGIQSIVDLVVYGKVSGYFEYLFYDFIFFPDKVGDIVFGTGLFPNVLTGKGTDVGYIQNIWQFGLLGSGLIYVYYIYAIWNWYKISSANDKAFALAIGAMMAVYMVKLNCFDYGQASVVFMGLMALALYGESQKCNGCLGEL